MMLLRHPSRTFPLEFLEQATDLSSEHRLGAHVYVLVLTMACVGAACHGVAMAIRKKYGEGHEKYWLEWRWWVGTILDGVAGMLIWPAMPFVSVQIFAPLVIVVQLGTSYILGLLIFNEKFALHHNIGFIFAVAGVIGVSMSTSHEAANFTIAQFWAAWVSVRFIITTVIILLALSGCFAMMERSTFWALCAAFLEGIQYICSRSIVDSIFEERMSFILQPAVFAAIALKVLCIVGIIHTSQLGLEANLSKFAGIYLCGCVFFMCIYGSAFFGDAMPINFVFFASAFFTLTGIWLLNQSEDILQKDMEGSKDLTGNPQESEVNVSHA